MSFETSSDRVIGWRVLVVNCVSIETRWFAAAMRLAGKFNWLERGAFGHAVEAVKNH